ncbi:YheC/YheD family protein [Brevibacillus composti]|uniref:YheC/YheD family protein n=1 Tax=Brevibacillus composti TaxID=2796470 RepID=A0A7T5EPZ0_9BACL|nr:YheC/YheD family protein [Brevibacillus composti]QUO43673.1 YheC/YheD family protein [Brevibacillus composti]
MKPPNVGKWSKHLVLLQDEKLHPYLPDTVRFSPEALWSHLEKYGAVILKPSGGGGGAGIIKLTQLEDEKFLVHSGSGKKTLDGRTAAVAYIRSLFRPKPYLIQPYLSLGQIQGRPFDVRVMIQRKKGQPWVVTGWLAKLAGPGYIVTNVARSRGKVLPLGTALAQSNCQVVPELRETLQELALTVGYRLGKKYPTLRMVGLDVGIDVSGHPWIIEANFRPAISLFQKLPDRRMYRQIIGHRSS